MIHLEIGQLKTKFWESFSDLKSRVTYREPLFRVDLNHALQQGLTVWRDEVGHVEDPALHLLQELTQVVVVKGEGALQGTQKTKKKNRRGQINLTMRRCVC